MGDRKASKNRPRNHLRAPDSTPIGQSGRGLSRAATESHERLLNTDKHRENNGKQTSGSRDGP